jgi:hypothetical protein
MVSVVLELESKIRCQWQGTSRRRCDYFSLLSFRLGFMPTSCATATIWVFGNDRLLSIFISGKEGRCDQKVRYLRLLQKMSILLVPASAC